MRIVNVSSYSWMLLLGLLFCVESLSAQSIIVHDPVMIRENSKYYLFATGQGIDVWSSADMKNWNKEKAVFAVAPQWAVDAVPGFTGHIWAPDISYHNGRYYLYYSVSAFGKNTSCIGVATNKTLDPDDPEFQWVDHGKVVQSYPGKNNWNAIDPNLILDEEGTPYLFFGSFWDGLQRVKLNSDLVSVAEDLDSISTVASRKAAKEDPTSLSADAGENAIEAPFVFKKGDYYYLFASIDYCCRGVKSTYKMIVGRSKNLTGPFNDKAGTDMAHGGGTIVLKGDKNWHGVGHNAVVRFDGKDYLVFHGYDAKDGGHPKLLIREISWDREQWPTAKL
ncbi:arabinan endo-1,5-alpha-L-arabinosidase [Mangrovibacterium marinum]|uniref:Arabinan endo-1,5-alpha-L-arabinosidase n=1 Tax=Mangrovibacterium marinum TaxID=1639118 RepID=A0A2T5BZE3_9BACT|nr:arabinan endo-1,5-alpha-L-arabinosidase [Mangrovibacterium marinum]PTN07639.1 arabinan endo-1,5-alpha-L-arabinosidase [Mangrovibacterium marinum]